MSTEEITAVVAAGIAFVSMVVSIVLSLLNYNQTKRINEITLKSDYFNEIFNGHLIKGIPKARKYIRFQEDRLVDTNSLVDELSRLRGDALFFKYSDKAFYNRLKELTQNIEDYLMECGNKRYEPEEQAEVYQKIHSEISKLYELVNNAKLGKYSDLE